MSWVKALTKIVTFALPFSNGIETVRTCILCHYLSQLFDFNTFVFLKMRKKNFFRTVIGIIVLIVSVLHIIKFTFHEITKVIAINYLRGVKLVIWYYVLCKNKCWLLVMLIQIAYTYLHGSLECKVSITHLKK